MKKDGNVPDLAEKKEQRSKRKRQGSFQAGKEARAWRASLARKHKKANPLLKDTKRKTGGKVVQVRRRRREQASRKDLVGFNAQYKEKKLKEVTKRYEGKKNLTIAKRGDVDLDRVVPGENPAQSGEWVRLRKKGRFYKPQKFNRRAKGPPLRGVREKEKPASGRTTA